MHHTLSRLGKQFLALLAATVLLGICCLPAQAVGGSQSEAMSFSKKLGTGINLGNTLEATGADKKTVSEYETLWGNPVTTKEMVDEFKAAGFKTLRIPVAWSNLMGPGHTINKDLMARVRQVVQYGLDNDMYVIINIHWDGGWLNKFPEDYDGSMKKYVAIWNQIAAEFKDYSDHLIFESLNEESAFDILWNPYDSKFNQKDRAYNLLNKINQRFTDIIRTSGGKNTRRYLLIAGYVTDVHKTVDPLFKMPQDPVRHSLVSVHYYTPSTFTLLEKDASWGKAANTWGTDAEVVALKADFQLLRTRFIDQGIPVVIGEFNCPSTKDAASAVKYVKTIRETAQALDLVPVLWETGGLFNRRTLKWTYPAVLPALFPSK